jgi:hypothetical protein
MSKRNYEDTAEYDFKSSSNLKSLKPTHDNYHKINNTYKERFLKANLFNNLKSLFLWELGLVISAT